jgi:hypothetical protein
MNAFPPMKPAAADDRSTRSTVTTTSLTIATDDEIKKLETQWKTDKEAFSTNLDTTLNACLATMDTKIDNVISTINDTMTQAFEKEMETFEAKMTKLVTDTMTAQSLKVLHPLPAKTLPTSQQQFYSSHWKQPYPIDPRPPLGNSPKLHPSKTSPWKSNQRNFSTLMPDLLKE